MILGVGLGSLPRPSDECQNDAHPYAQNGDEETVAERFPPRAEKTENWHGGRSDRERYRSGVSLGWSDACDVVTDGKEEVDESEAEEGDMPQSRQAATEAAVSPHPVFPMEE